jgi:hypothetical protein
MDNYLLIISLGLFYLVYFLLRQDANRLVHAKDNEDLVLRLSHLYAVFALLLFIFVVMILLTIDFSLAYRFWDLLLIFIIPGVMIIASIVYMALYYFNHRILITDDQITVRSYLGKEQTVKWSDIQACRSDYLRSRLILVTSSGTIPIHRYISRLASIQIYLKTKSSCCKAIGFFVG